MFQMALFSFLSPLYFLGLTAAILYSPYYNSAFIAPLIEYSFLFSFLKSSNYFNASQSPNTSSKEKEMKAKS